MQPLPIDFSSLTENIHTPAYLFSESMFQKRADAVAEAFGPQVGLCFSIKANPFLLSFLPDIFSNVEVCSPGELEICKALCVAPEKIIFSGVNKRRADVEAALDYRCGVLTAESLRHLELIESCAEERGEKVDVLLRLASASQFGMDESILREILGNQEKWPHVHLAGIHYFTGTQKRKPVKIIEELDAFEAILGSIAEETGYLPERVEYGTGLAVDYFAEDPEQEEMKRLTAIADRIRVFGAVKGRRLTVEMGRFFAAPCGFYLTRVEDLKVNGQVKYAILDGGLHQLKYDGQLSGMQVPKLTHLKKDAEGVYREYPCTASADENNSNACTASVGEKKAEDMVTLCGSLCTTMDVLARGAYLPDLAEGDILVFHETGAYSVSEGMAAFLSRDLPEVWLLGADGKLLLVRERRQTWGWNCAARGDD